MIESFLPTYECSVRCPKFDPEKGKSNTAKETDQTTHSHEKTKLRWISDQSHVFNSNAHQRFTNTRGLDKADGDAVLTEHGEIKHGKADSSKEEAVFCKELESFRWEEKTNKMRYFYENLCALPSDRVRSRSFLFQLTPPLLAHLQIGWGC